MATTKQITAQYRRFKKLDDEALKYLGSGDAGEDARGQMADIKCTSEELRLAAMLKEETIYLVESGVIFRSNGGYAGELERWTDIVDLRPLLKSLRAGKAALTKRRKP